MKTPSHATCKNYRPNKHSVTLPGSCLGHQGQVIADLYDSQTGEFLGSAIVADVGASGLGAAQRYCDEANTIEQTQRKIRLDKAG